MKTLFLSVAATALILAAPTAFAADEHHDHGPGDNGKHTEHMAAPTHADHMTAPADHKAAPAMTMSGPAMSGPSMSGSSHGSMHDHKGMTMTTAAPTTPPKGWTVRTNKNNPMQGGDNKAHAAIHFNRHNVTASHHFHYRGGNYRWPHGYHYQRWSFGMTLPSIFWGRDYWIDDYSDYGLAYPPPGCVWVRYGDDAILIDEYTGEILEVVYGQFY